MNNPPAGVSRRARGDRSDYLRNLYYDPNLVGIIIIFPEFPTNHDTT